MMTRQEMEARRLAAARGLTGDSRELTEKHGISRTTLCRWRRALRKGGIDALRLRRSPGRTRKVSRADLVAFLREMHQDRTPLGEEMVEAVKAKFGVRYDVNHLTKTVRVEGIRGTLRRRRSGAQIPTEAGRYVGQPMGHVEDSHSPASAGFRVAV
jgi:transposase